MSYSWEGGSEKIGRKKMKTSFIKTVAAKRKTQENTKTQQGINMRFKDGNKHH